MQKRPHEKVVKSKVAAQKWLDEFVLPHPTGNRHQNSLELLFKKLP